MHLSVVVILCAAVGSSMNCNRSDVAYSATEVFGHAEITVELVSISVFAEYKKFLVITLPGKKPIRQELFLDTGGYSWVAVFETPSDLVIEDTWNDYYLLNKSTGV